MIDKLLPGDIIAYNDTTFNNCILNNCMIIHSGSHKATFENSSIINCSFNNTPVVGESNAPALLMSGFDWNIPNDITAYLPN